MKLRNSQKVLEVEQGLLQKHKRKIANEINNG